MKRNILIVVLMILNMLSIIHISYLHRKIKDKEEKHQAIIRNFEIVEKEYKQLYEDYNFLESAYDMLEEENHILGSYIADQ